MKTVCILMSTYNGEKYLEEQLQSLLMQKNVNVRILIRDDGSSDKTVEIIRSYMQEYKNIMLVLGKRIGPAKSFMTLLKISPEADYYAFCDQDDFWEEHKLINAVQKIEEEESDDNKTPVMYYSNLKVVDSSLNFIRLAHKKSMQKTSPYNALIDNDVTGCTVVLNNSLRNVLNAKEPGEITMHDAWCNIVCSFFGKEVYDDRAFILYRQHEDNAIGMGKRQNILKSITSKFKRVFAKNIQPRLSNAQQFYYCYGEKLIDERRRKVEKLINYKNTIGNRIKLLLDFDIRTNGLYKNIKYKILIMLGKI